MIDIISEINQKNSDEVRRIFVELVTEYLKPSYGSMSKRDFDILLFTKLQDLGVIESNPEIYDLVSGLKVTRTKARNLLYETKLRTTNSSELDKELKDILSKPIFLKDGDKISLEIGNPYLIDHMRSKLKQLGHITDGSFSAELVKITLSAYSALVDDILPDDFKRQMTEKLKESEVIQGTSFKDVVFSIASRIAVKVAGSAGEALVDQWTREYLAPILKDLPDDFDVYIQKLKDFWK